MRHTDSACLDTVERLSTPNISELFGEHPNGDIEPFYKGQTGNAVASVPEMNLRSYYSNLQSGRRKEFFSIRYQSPKRISSTTDISEEDRIENLP